MKNDESYLLESLRNERINYVALGTSSLNIRIACVYQTGASQLGYQIQPAAHIEPTHSMTSI